MEVTLFSKPSCQLCDALKYELLDLEAEYGFALHEEFVDADGGREENGERRVPYVEIRRSDGTRLMLGSPLKQPDLRRTILAEFSRRSGDQA